MVADEDLLLSIKVHADHQVNYCQFNHSENKSLVVSCGNDHLIKVLFYFHDELLKK